jgi:hypothetical protein
VVAAQASLGDDVAVVLQHVRPIAAHDAFYFGLCVIVRRRQAEVDRSSYKLIRLPVCGDICNQPVLCLVNV